MHERARLIAGNWKMNLEEWAAVELAGSIADGLGEGAAEVVICPPFPWLVPVSAVLQGSRVRLGAQDCSAETSGAFTGQVSATMLNGLCSHVIVGHSERRRDCCESNELVGRKAAAAIDAGLVPIACVGESIDVRNAGNAVSWVDEQVAAIVAGVGAERLGRLVIAYEPIWAIGSGRSASPDDAEEIGAAIRQQLKTSNPGAAEAVRILYGGSATPANARAYLDMSDVDGLLVGGACLKSDSFLEIVAIAG
ncbi:MAG: triose-phosphate isomerase [Thermomicrobiales bacterium]|nr:triose-phosphate isomerase [Thermomicrobiales bacterium]